MSIEIKAGSLTDFFASARKTAKEIDEGKRLTRKNTIWVEPEDLADLLKPERMRLLCHLRDRQKVAFTDLVIAMHRTAVSLNRDLKLLAKYQLVRTYNEKNPGHGVHKVVESTFGDQRIEFRAEV